MKFNGLYLKYLIETNANRENVQQRVEDELISYVNARKQNMTKQDFSKAESQIKKIAKELNPDKIFDDLMALGKLLGLKDSYSRLVGKIISIVDELENPETTKQDIIGEPQPEDEKNEDSEEE